MFVKTYSRFRIALLLFCIVFGSPVAFAQFGASLRGTVQDPSGAVIPGASVTLTNLETGTSQTTLTKQTGFYQFSELGPGNYVLKTTANGFQSSTLSNIMIEAEAPSNLNVTLQIGGATQTITVNANDVSLLQTANANINSTIDSKNFTRQPLFGRDPYEMLRTAPGVTGDGSRSGSGTGNFLPNTQGPGQSNFGIFQTENQVQIASAGQRVTSNTYEIDGVGVDSLLHGGSAIVTPNIESVSQMTVTSSSYSAQNGRNVGALVQTVTKGGTNALHGSAYFQYDEPGLNAFQPYGGPAGALPQRVQNKQREYAASLGGPILKNKLFWFVSYEGVGNSNTTYDEEYVPTPQFLSYIGANRKNGIVSGILNGPGAAPNVVKVLPINCQNVLANTQAGQPSCQVVQNGANVGAFTGNVNTYTTNTGSATPGNLATFDGIPDINYDEIAVPARFRGNQYNARVDWNITPKDVLSLSGFVSKLDQTSGDPATGAQLLSTIPFKPLNTSGTLVYIHTFSPSLLNELRGNFTRFADNQINDSNGLVNWGIPRLEVQGYVFGRLQAGAASGATTPAIFAENTYEVKDTVTKTFGSHTVAIGGLVRWEQDNDNLSGLARPDYVFQGIYNYANDAPIFEQIAADPNTGGVANARRYFRDKDLAFFVQHDWKVTPNLTLNTGLRWEYFEPLYNKGSKINEPVFGSTPGYELVNARLVPVNHLYNSNYKNFGPKIGFAWTPGSSNQKLVVRGGFGISYDRLDDQLFINGYENGPGYALFSQCCATTSQQQALANGILFERGGSNSPFSYPANPVLKTGINPATGTPNAVGGLTPEVEVYGTAPHTDQPTLYSYSLGMEYQLAHQMVATIGYQGSVGYHFPRLVDQNFLYCTQQPCVNGATPTAQTPFYAAYIPTTDVHTNYNGLNLGLSKQYTNGFTVSANYTYSKSLDQGSNEGPGALSNQTDPANPRTEYGPSDFDLRHRVTVTGLWDLPKVHGGHGVMGQITSGWQVNGIFTYHTGFPWTPVTGVPTVAVVQSAATLQPTRPLAYYGGAGHSCSNSAYIHNGNFPGGGKKYFEIGTPGPPGIGRNSWNGPCYLDTDMSFAKQQPFNMRGHAASLRFQANFYNIFNKTNLMPITFGAPEATIENSLFGLSPGTDAGRVIEFLARLQF